MKTKKGYLLIVLILCFASGSLAQKAKFDGYIELGAEHKYNDLYVESFYKAKVEFKIDLNDRTKVEIDLRAESDEQQIKLNEASVDYDFSDEFRISLGALKKRYGTEELVSREKLATVRRSMINRFLSPLGYVSRDPGIQMRWRTSEQEFFGGFNFNSSHNLTIMSRYSRKNVGIFSDVGGGFHLVKHLNQQGYDYSYAASVNFNYSTDNLENLMEIFYGMDPVETAYRDLSGSDEKVNFFALRLQSANKFPFKNKILTGIEPLIVFGFLSPDTKHLDVNKLELLLGLNIYIDENIRFMINGDLIFSNTILNKTERSLNESNFIAQFQVSW